MRWANRFFQIQNVISMCKKVVRFKGRRRGALISCVFWQRTMQNRDCESPTTGWSTRCTVPIQNRQFCDWHSSRSSPVADSRWRWGEAAPLAYWLRIFSNSCLFPCKRHIARCVHLRQMTTGLIHCLPPSPPPIFKILGSVIDRHWHRSTFPMTLPSSSGSRASSSVSSSCTTPLSNSSLAFRKKYL